MACECGADQMKKGTEKTPTLRQVTVYYEQKWNTSPLISMRGFKNETHSWYHGYELEWLIYIIYALK